MIAAVLQSSTGYGSSIIGTPILLLLYPMHTAFQKKYRFIHLSFDYDDIRHKG